MKTKLTKEESQHLIDLGVPKEKASDKISYGFAGYYSIFRIEDFLNEEILPKEIEVNGEIAELCFDWNSKAKRWCAAYSWMCEEYEAWEEELIDAFYQLACWYYSDYLKNRIN